MMADRRLAYVLLRLLLGIDLLGHGGIRIFHGAGGFAAGMVKSMAETPLPGGFVYLFGCAVPFVELLLGLLLVAGLLTRQALIWAALLMSALMVGITLKQDWPTAGTQLVYGLTIFILMFLRSEYDVTWAGLVRTVREP